MTISTSITVDGSSTVAAHSVSFGTPVTLGLTSTVGVASCTYDFPGASRADAPVLTVSYGGTVGAATFIISGSGITDGAGCSYILRATLNGGLTNGRPDPSLIKTVVLGVPNAFGVVPISAQETTQRDATIGWTYAFNQLIGAAALAGADRLESVRFAVAETVLTSGLTTVITSGMADGISPVSGDEILIYGDVQSSTQGTWVLNASLQPATRRATDEGLLFGGTEVYVREGTAQGKKIFRQTRDAAVNFGEPMRWTRTDFLGGVEADGFAYARIRSTDNTKDLPVVAVDPTTGEVKLGNDPDDLFYVRFDGGLTALPLAATGERLQFSRASAAAYYRNGVEVTAASGDPRIQRGGILLEPATTNLIVAPENNDLTVAAWTKSNTTCIAGPASLDGDSYSRLKQVATTSLQSISINAAGLAANPTGFSFRVSKTLGGAARYIYLADATVSHYVQFDLVLGTLTRTSDATNVRGYCVDLGDEWLVGYCSVAGLASGAQYIGFAPDGTTIGNVVGAVTNWLDIRRVQLEYNSFPTTWTATTRAAELLRVFPNRQIPSEFCVEVEYEPIHGVTKRGTTHEPIVTVGAFGAATCLEIGQLAGQGFVSVWDASNAVKTITGIDLSSESRFVGPRRIAACSSGLARPAMVNDGRESPTTPTGAGTGLFQAMSPSHNWITIGGTSTSVIGGVIVRSVRVTRGRVPRSKVLGAQSYTEHLTRGHCSDAHVVAFLGDSNTRGWGISGVTAPFCGVAAAAKGLTWAGHNYGVGSDTTRQMLARWREDIKPVGYSALVFWGGVNDSLVGQTDYRDAFAAAQQTLLEAELSGVSKVIAINILPGGHAPGDPQRVFRDAFNVALAALCTARGYHLVDAWTLLGDAAVNTAISGTYNVDGTHINQAGHTALGAAVAALL